MRLERVIIRGLRALRDRDDTFLDAERQPLSAACLRGLNGSGKTTYLKAIGELWQWFRRCTQRQRYADSEHLMLAEGRLVAALFSGLPGPRARMWIAVGHPAEILTLPEGPANPYTIDGGRVTWAPDVLLPWRQAFEQAENGLSPAPPPNVVFIEAEQKYVPELTAEQLLDPKPTSAYYAVPRYLPEARGASHLEPLLRTLFLARRSQWDLLVRLVRELRPGLELLDRFDEATQRPLFQLATGEYLTVHHLSAGERSLLINLCMVLRWLAPGGLLLLDEPELHLHVSLIASSLAATHDCVAEHLHGQVVVASHAPEVWDYFRTTSAVIDLGIST